MRISSRMAIPFPTTGSKDGPPITFSPILPLDVNGKMQRLCGERDKARICKQIRWQTAVPSNRTLKNEREGTKGSRITIIFNGWLLFTGDAGSGLSGIRKYILENDLLEAIVALPTMFFITRELPPIFGLFPIRSSVQNAKAKFSLIMLRIV